MVTEESLDVCAQGLHGEDFDADGRRRSQLAARYLRGGEGPPETCIRTV